MGEPTLDELVAFMKKHGAERVDSITDEKSAIKHFRATSRVYKEERDSLLKQRDELIEDIAKLRENNANLEKVANRFDLVKENIREELDNYGVLYKDTKNPSYSLLSGVYEELFNYIEELERGSDG